MKRLLLLAIISLSTLQIACSDIGIQENSNSDSRTLLQGSIFTAPIQFANIKIYKIINEVESYIGTVQSDKLGKFSFPTQEYGPFIARYESGSGKRIGSNKNFYFDNWSVYLQDSYSAANTFAFLATYSLKDTPTALEFSWAYNKIIRTAVLFSSKAGYFGIDSESLKRVAWSPQAEVAIVCLAVASGAQDEDAIHSLTWLANFTQMSNELSIETIVGMTEFNQAQLDLIERCVKNVLDDVNSLENTNYTIDALRDPSQKTEEQEITGLYFFTEDPQFLSQGQYEAKGNVNTINVSSNSSDKLKGELNFWVMGLNTENAIKVYSQDNLEKHYAELEKQMQDDTFVYAYNKEGMIKKLQNGFYPNFSHFVPASSISVEVSPHLDIAIIRNPNNRNEFGVSLNLPASTNQSYKITVIANFGQLGTVTNYIEINARSNFGSDIDYAKTAWNTQFQREVSFSHNKVTNELTITNITGSPSSWKLNARDEANNLYELAKGTSTSVKVKLNTLAKGKYKIFFSSYGKAIYNGETINNYGDNRPRGYYELSIE